MSSTLERELFAAAAMGAAAALLIWRARQDLTEWLPSSPFHWERKHAEFTKLNAKDIMVITDFDATLTTGDSEQCHDMIGNNKLLSDEFRAEFAPLLDWTTNAAIDGVEWWDRAHELMIKHGTPKRNIVPRLVREATMVRAQAPDAASYRRPSLAACA